MTEAYEMLMERRVTEIAVALERIAAALEKIGEWCVWNRDGRA
jgi:hypothetical protein